MVLFLWFWSGLVIAGTTFISVLIFLHFKTCSEKTIGTVVEINLKPDTDPTESPMYESVIEFTIDGVTRRVPENSRSQTPVNKVGDVIWVWYSAKNPEMNFTANSFIIFPIVGFLMIAGWVVFASLVIHTCRS